MKMKNTAQTYLFLDDLRTPLDAYSYSLNTVFFIKKWKIIRSYTEFIQWITKNGLPYFVSFDHDLSDVESTHEKTGYDCALWLVDYCLNNQLQCPDFYCHSMNPVGKTKIMGLLEQFKSFQNT